MPSVLLVLIAAVTAGYLGGGRLTRIPEAGVRLTGLAALGCALQYAPVGGLDPGVYRAMLWLSFALLTVFLLVNLRHRGFALLLAGVLLNLTVIALNDGMPIDASALRVAGDGGQVAELQAGVGGAKYHLAGPGDELIPLADVVVLPRPVGEVVSVGDLLVDAGLAWFLFAAMGATRRRRPGAVGGQAGEQMGERLVRSGGA
jgi:uncharacterized protein DUF5317